MPIYVPGKVVLRQTWQPMDPDAAAYIAAVEAADTTAGSPGGLEEKVKIAIDNFVLGCKADGIWDAIKASCILAGARTLDGALAPLVGTAPTNFNFVAGDYDRETGLKGDGSTKSLNSNRNNNSDPQDDKHMSVYVSEAHGTVASIAPTYMGAGSSSNNDSFLGVSVGNGNCVFSLNNPGISGSLIRSQTGLVATSRSNSAFFLYYPGPATINRTSGSPSDNSIGVFTSFEGSNPRSLNCTNARLAFYSIGESLDLALLDTRVTALISAIGAAIP
jgi:hypothetical protein